MVKHKTIKAFFKRKTFDKHENCIFSTLIFDDQASSEQTIQVQQDEQPRKIQKVSIEEFDINCLECDPDECVQIWEYPINQRDEL